MSELGLSADELGGPRRALPKTPEGREQQLVSLAVDLAERQIREGRVSAQVLTHYLKLGSSREQLEQERIRHENELSEVKKQALEAQERMEETYKQALLSMRQYQGIAEEEDPDDY